MSAVVELAAKLYGVSAGDAEVVLELGRLDWSKKKNWVENEGGLPKMIEDVALALMRENGWTRERAIATAISQTKKNAAKGNAKAAKAIAQWEKMKASARVKRAKS